MNSSLRILLFLSLLPAGRADAQLTWDRLPGPDGTWNTQCIAVDPSNGTVYAATPTGGGVYRSSDNGATWTRRSSGLPVDKNVTDIVVSGGAVYAVADKVFKSADDGQTWEELTASPGGMTNLHATSGGVVFAGSAIAAGGQGISRTTDGGTTWIPSSNGLPSYVIFLTYYRSVSAITSDASGNLWCSVNSGNASTEAGVYTSTDGGANWTRSSSGLLASAAVEGVRSAGSGRLYVAVSNYLYTTTNDGSTWTQADTIPMAGGSLVRATALNGAGEVFVATSNGLYRGAAGGTDLARVGNASLPGTLYEVAVSPSGGTVFAGGLDTWGVSGGCFRSTDNGDTWAESKAGMNAGFVSALGVTPSGTILVGLGLGRVEYSTDGGTTFARAALPVTGISALRAVVAVRGNANGAIVAGTAEGMYASTDGGATWTKPNANATRAFGSDPAQNFYAATGVGVMKSTDDGASWAGMGGGGDSYSVFHTAAGTVLSGTYNSGINRTTDGGTTWTNSGTALFGNITIGRFIQLDNGTIYTHTLGGIFRSTDDGASWSAVTGTPVGTQYRTLTSAGGTIFLGTSGGLFRSVDGAATWENFPTGLLWSILDYLAVAGDGRLLGSGGCGIYRSNETVTTSVETVSPAVPSGYSLSGNYPNPFNPSTAFDFTVPVGSHVEIAVFDALGRKVAVLADRTFEPGSYRAVWEAARAASGAYYCTLRASVRGGREVYSQTRRMLLVR